MYKKASAAVLAASIGLGSGSASAMLPSGGFENPFFVNANSGLPLKQKGFDCMAFWTLYDKYIERPISLLLLHFLGNFSHSEVIGNQTHFWVFNDNEKLLDISQRICDMVESIETFKAQVSNGEFEAINRGLVNFEVLEKMQRLNDEIQKIQVELEKFNKLYPTDIHIKIGLCKEFVLQRVVK